ncbi:hypothetical protein BGZ83_003310 [Gryganskiella cystojenkinii]|nr:hypothetical protein BGZ83_003310 [Gryganskiella cystojenkinii]
MLPTTRWTLFLILSALLSSSTLHPGAEATKTVIDLVSTDPGFSRLIKELQRHRLIPYLNNRKTCTFFAPTNDAFHQWDQDHTSVDKDMLLYHILPENILSGALKDSMLLETVLIKDGYLGENQEGQRVAVAKPAWRPGRRNKILVGDAELLKKDWIADNGVVHAVNRLMVPPVDIVDTMQKHTELNALYNIIHMAGLDNKLRRHQPFTLFAPSESAIQRLSDVQRLYLAHEQGREDLKITFHHHVHSGALYKEDVQQGSSSISTLEGQELIVSLEENRWMVDNSEVQQSDILASNGVIHMVSRPLLPSSLVWTAAKYLIGLNATQFVERLRQAGLSHFIDDPEASYTIFAPQDRALAWVSDDVNDDLLRYHIVSGRKQLHGFKDGQLLETELYTDELNGHSQRSKVTIRQDHQQSLVAIDGVEIKGAPVQVGKSLIYIIARPLELPLLLVDKMKQEATLSGFVQALKDTGLGRRLSDARGVTVFAPSDVAWRNLGVVNNYLRLHENSKSGGSAESLKAMEAVVRYTIVDTPQDGVLYSADIKPGRSVVKTSQGDELVIDRKDTIISVSEGREERVGQVKGRLSDKDILVNSGVVHTISAVTLPPSLSINLLNVLQGAGTSDFLHAFHTSNLSRLLTEWDQDFTIFVPTNEAFKKANLEGALNDAEFMGRLVRLHVVPGKVMELNKDDSDEEPSLLNAEARLSLRGHSDGQTFGVRVKGARSNKEAKITNFGRAHPAWPEQDELEDCYSPRGKSSRSSMMMRLQSSQRQGVEWDMPEKTIKCALPGGIVYVIDRVLLPGDPEPLGVAWFWIGVILLALLGTAALCALTTLSIHALIQELRQIEGYVAVPTRDRDTHDEEEAVEGNGHLNGQINGHGSGHATEQYSSTNEPAATATASDLLESRVAPQEVGTDFDTPLPDNITTAATSGDTTVAEAALGEH